MKIVYWLLLGIGILVFFNAPGQLTGWFGIMAAVVGASMLIYRWSGDTGYPTPADEHYRTK
jgi:hypothetical protein